MEYVGNREWESHVRTSQHININSHNNFFSFLWAQTLQSKLSRKCCLVYAVKNMQTHSLFPVPLPHSDPDIPGFMRSHLLQLLMNCMKTQWTHKVGLVLESNLWISMLYILVSVLLHSVHMSNTLCQLRGLQTLLVLLPLTRCISMSDIPRTSSELSAMRAFKSVSNMPATEQGTCIYMPIKSCDLALNGNCAFIYR